MGVELDYAEYLSYGTKKVVIAFAGGNQNRYQFGPTLTKLGLSHILTRDSTQMYHMFGVKGIGDRNAVATYIKSFIYSGFYVITIGVSSGAYAALLYGQLADVHETYAISPLTGRDLDDFDPRWHKQIYDPSMPQLDDLRKYFKDGPNMKCRAYISNGEACELDRQMATRIKIKDIVLIGGYAHGKLAQAMRDRGMFKEILG